MLEQLTDWEPKVQLSDRIKLDDLEITFHRTIRVPDNDKTNSLPPSMGHFPLFKVSQFAKKLPSSMARKGGLFFPMYQNEAMWINFDSKRKYAIKIYVGGVNAVSGEVPAETAATALRRRNILKKGGSIQDYVVVPGQEWLDGPAVEPGKVRQFVATPMGTGYSVEAQITSQESTGGVQFEITRLDPPVRRQDEMINVWVKTLTGKSINCRISRLEKVENLKCILEEKETIPPDQQRLIVHGKQMQDGRSLADYKTENEDVICMHLILRGGGPGYEMNLAAGGLIKQSVIQFPKREYQKSKTVTFNVQILSSASFRKVTGRDPPPSPVSADTYAAHGFPFFSLFGEPTNVSGDFASLKSIGQINGTSEPALSFPIVDAKTGGSVTGTEADTVGFFNPNGANRPFRFGWEVAEEINEKSTIF